MRTRIKKSIWPISVSVALAIIGFAIHWIIGGKMAQAIGGCLIAIGIIVCALAIRDIFKENGN